MDSLLSFPVGLFHPLQHAGLSRRTRYTDYKAMWFEALACRYGTVIYFRLSGEVASACARSPIMAPIVSGASPFKFANTITVT
jgi:hypothetical protein